MLPDWVSNPGPLTYDSGALPIVLRGPAAARCLPYLFSFIKWDFASLESKSVLLISAVRSGFSFPK